MGFSVILPKWRPVGSPKRSAIQAWAASWRLKENKKTTMSKKNNAICGNESLDSWNFQKSLLSETSGEYQEGVISVRSVIRTWNDNNPNVIFRLSLT